jgi:outer membrane protein TolC
MNLPLWRDSYSAGERQARAQKASIEQQKVETENVLLTKASQAHYEYRDSIRKIRLYRDTLIPKGRELLRSSEAAYREGTIDFLSLIDAQRMLLDYHLSLQRALADNRQKLADLEMLAGTELNLN